MKFIAHRGNLYGPQPNYENKPETIEKAISLGFDCEIDIWFLEGAYWLGHDYPETRTTYEFVFEKRKNIWVHCKNLDALLKLTSVCNCFYHDKDVYTITSRGDIWGNIGSPMNPHVIQVMPEKACVFSFECAGICSDFPVHYKNIYMGSLEQ